VLGIVQNDWLQEFDSAAPIAISNQKLCGVARRPQPIKSRALAPGSRHRRHEAPSRFLRSTMQQEHPPVQALKFGERKRFAVLFCEPNSRYQGLLRLGDIA